MDIKVHTEPFHIIEVENLFSEGERLDMFNEMAYLQKQGVFVEPLKAGTALSNSGAPLKENMSLYLDNIWKDRTHSSILNHNRKLFNLLAMEEELKESWFFKRNCLNVDTTLISYYENADHYKPHSDIAYITALTWFFKEPKKFSGGSVTFDDYDITFDISNSLTLLFPSNINHSVSEVVMSKEFENTQNGRFCMAQFLMISPH